VRSSYKRMGLYSLQLSARSRLVHPQLRTLVLSEILGNTAWQNAWLQRHRSSEKDRFFGVYLLQIKRLSVHHRPRPYGLHAVAYSTGGILCLFAIMTAHHQLICGSSVSPCLSKCWASCFYLKFSAVFNKQYQRDTENDWKQQRTTKAV